MLPLFVERKRAVLSTAAFDRIYRRLFIYGVMGDHGQICISVFYIHDTADSNRMGMDDAWYRENMEKSERIM